MKVKFTCSPKGRPEYKLGDVVEFKSEVEMTYARKFLARGWAEPADSDATKAIKDIEQDKKDAAALTTKENTVYAEQVRGGERGPAAQFSPTQSAPGK